MTRLVLLFWLLATPLMALDPSMMLDDPALEARARALDHEIRCVKCQSESVASSNADWAQDAKERIRDLVASGATDAEVKQWFLDRYGEFVLMDPPKTGSTLVLWLAAPAMLIVALGGATLYLRGRSRPQAADDSLSDAEQARLREILRD